MAKFNVGDKVRILDVDAITFGFNHYYNGMVTEIIRIDRGNDIFLRNKKGEEGIYVGKRELHAIELVAQSTPKYRTEKRKANVGERILITNAEYSFGDYANGDILTVKSQYDDGMTVGVKVRELEGAPHIFHEEYEVIVESKPSKNERISLLESQVAELQAKVEALQKKRKPAVALTQAPTIHNITVNLGENSAKTADEISKAMRKFVASASSVSVAELTPNEQRKAVIERAKAFVAGLKRTGELSGETFEYREYSFNNSGKGTGDAYNVEYIVNREKRTVVAILRGFRSGRILKRGIAKCAPDDVFNADIGKAIALGRALGLDVSEFENAVKPTEAVSGQLIQSIERHTGRIRFTHRVSATENTSTINYQLNEDDSYSYAKITDDSEAQY